MNATCQECQPFIDETERVYGETLSKYAFELAECYGEREGRECQVMYRASIGNLLFVLQDGVSGSFVGKVGTRFPPFVLLRSGGEFGWYATLTLAEVESGEDILTRKLMRQFISRKVYSYEWGAKILAERIERLFRFLEVKDEATLKRMIQDRLRHNEGRWE
ncbi:MAG: hypothetical protein H6638_13545 [Ardenticatenales bacterium]|nr:hypothetical protein [Ardenticatenales bacterium]